jgi:uncharacterized membrane protein (DUF2068 family)
MSVGELGSLLGVRRLGSRSKRDDSKLVLVIGVFKLVKAAVLITLGIVALAGASDELAHTLAHATRWTGAFAGRELIQRGLAKLLSLDERTVHRIGVASLVYAAVFATEGIGLVLGKRWAEWLTVFVTGSFIPIEIYELVHKPGVGKVIALVLNVAIVAYLVWRRLSERRRH